MPPRPPSEHIALMDNLGAVLSKINHSSPQSKYLGGNSFFLADDLAGHGHSVARVVDSVSDASVKQPQSLSPLRR